MGLFRLSTKPKLLFSMCTTFGQGKCFNSQLGAWGDEKKLEYPGGRGLNKETSSWVDISVFCNNNVEVVILRAFLPARTVYRGILVTLEPGK